MDETPLQAVEYEYGGHTFRASLYNGRICYVCLDPVIEEFTRSGFTVSAHTIKERYIYDEIHRLCPGSYPYDDIAQVWQQIISQIGRDRTVFQQPDQPPEEDDLPKDIWKINERNGDR